MASSKFVLSHEIWRDVVSNFWSYLLLVLAMASAFSVIYFTHLNRQTTTELELLLTERDELDIEYRNLILEQNALAETSEIEAKAEKQLSMKRPDAQSEVYIRLR